MATKKAEGPAFFLTRIHLDRGGYAKVGGRYYGVGQPVFRLERYDTGAWVEDFRAADMAAAKDKVRKRHPGARFPRA